MLSIDRSSASTAKAQDISLKRRRKEPVDGKEIDGIQTSGHGMAFGVHPVTVAVVLFTSPGCNQASQKFTMNTGEVHKVPPLIRRAIGDC